MSEPVQGLGNVGFPLCLVVTEPDKTRVDAAVETFGATAVAVDEVYFQQVDIFAPCALDSVINRQIRR